MEQATFFYSQIRRQLCLRHVRMSSNPDLAALQDGLQCTDRRFNPWTEVCMANRRNLCRVPKVGWRLMAFLSGSSARFIDEVQQHGQVQVQKGGVLPLRC